MIKHLTFLSFIGIAFGGFAQMQIDTRPIFEENNLFSRYTSPDYASGQWYFAAKGLGLVITDFDSNQVPAYPRNSDGFHFLEIDLKANGTIVATQESGDSVFISRNGGETFVGVDLPFSSRFVREWQDTLYALEDEFANAGRLHFSADFGESWQAIGQLPFYHGNSWLYLMQGGYPVYRAVNPSTLEVHMYEVKSSGFVNMNSPGLGTGVFLDGDADRVFCIVVSAGGTDLYVYQRSTGAWTNLSGQFAPYSFAPSRIEVSDKQLMYTVGVRSLATVEDLRAYVWDGENMTDIPLPSVASVNYLRCENDTCLLLSEGEYFFSYDMGVNWTQLSFFHGPIHASKDSLALIGDKFYRFQNSVWEATLQVGGGQVHNASIKQESADVFMGVDFGGEFKLWHSVDYGSQWNVVNTQSMGNDLTLKTNFGDRALIYSEQDGYFWGNDSVGWNPLSGFKDLFGDGRFWMQNQDRIFMLPEGKEALGFSNSWDLTDVEFVFTPEGSGNGGQVLDVQVLQDKVYVLAKHYDVSQQKFRWEFLVKSNASSVWEVVFESQSIAINTIVDPGLGLFAFQEASGRGFELFQWEAQGLNPVYVKFPEVAQVLGWSILNNAFHIFTSNAGLWTMPMEWLGLEEGGSEQQATNPLKLFPNPSMDGQLQVEWPGMANQSLALTICDVQGNRVYYNPDYTTESFSHLPSGIYLVQVRSSSGQSQQAKWLKF